MAHKMTEIRGNKKVINGWAMYDWANSVYSLTITTAIFPQYYKAVTDASGGVGQAVSFFGLQINNNSLYSYCLSAAFLIAAVVSPLLSAIADYSGNKKAFMKFFCYLGSISCASLYFFTGPDTLELGMIAFILAGIGFTGSIVFYNAYLPEIALESDQDRVSAKGFAMGYIGSVILLLINLGLILFPDAVFDVAGKQAEIMAADPVLKAGEALSQARDSFAGITSRIAFLTVGIWWAGFAQITFWRLPKNIYHRKPKGNILNKGYQELGDVWRQLKRQPMLKRFLLSFFFYSMGVQTIMYMATIFAAEEIQMTTEFLIGLVLIIQLVAIPGAYLFSYLSGRLGNIRALLAGLFIWTLIPACVFFITDQWTFTAIAFVVGLVMGGIQALSRSTYSKMLPETRDHASYFSFYDIAEKVSIVLGTVAFGLATQLSGSMRIAAIPILAFFLVAIVIMFKIKGRDIKTPANDIQKNQPDHSR